MLAGFFTRGSIEQLRSVGFNVLYFPYDTLIEAFASEGICAQFDETTPDKEFEKCVRQISSAPKKKLQRVKDHLIESNRGELERFLASLKARLDRMVEKVVVLPLYGESYECASIGEALDFVKKHDTSLGARIFQRFEITVVFTNGDRVDGCFSEAGRVQEFLTFVAG